MRVPGTHNEFLINPYGALYEQMTASCMIRINFEGEVLFNPAEGYEVNRSGYIIHSAIHADRPDVECIIHTHTLSGSAVASMQCGLLPIAQMSIRWVKGVSYHDYESIVAMDERDRMVRDLGTNDIMILRNHGLLTCGRSIAECFNNMFWLKHACDLQVMFLSCNQQIGRLSDTVIEKTGAPTSRAAAAMPSKKVVCSNGRRCCTNLTASMRRIESKRIAKKWPRERDSKKYSQRRAVKDDLRCSAFDTISRLYLAIDYVFSNLVRQ